MEKTKKAIEKLQTLLYNRFVNEKRTTPTIHACALPPLTGPLAQSV
jgi:hypothetical protein